MTQTLLLLTVALAVAVAAPLVASVVPGRSVPETVILVFAGAVLGRYLPFSTNEGLDLLSELGMAFLFLMAGFEIVPSEMSPAMTRHAALSWCASLAIALVFTLVVPLRRFVGLGAYAFAILLTTTAYGTLAPIMRERNLAGTKVGEAVTVYGALGEVLPIIAMAFLLSTRAPLRTTVALVLYVGVCVGIASFPRRAQRLGRRLQAFLRTAGAATSESSVRAVSLLLVFLVFLAGAWGFDAALGAFAAGFTLRALLPEGDESLEARLRGISSGFFVPVFFFVSGASIDLAAVFAAPGLLVGFIALLVLVRGVVVAASLRLSPETRGMSWQETFSAATYCTMALPLVVAITNVAVDPGGAADHVVGASHERRAPRRRRTRARLPRVAARGAARAPRGAARRAGSSARAASRGAQPPLVGGLPGARAGARVASGSARGASPYINTEIKRPCPGHPGRVEKPTRQVGIASRSTQFSCGFALRATSRSSGEKIPPEPFTYRPSVLL